jgi:hypothetical protein
MLAENNRLFRNDMLTFYIPFHLLMNNYLSITTSWWKTYDKLTLDRLKYLSNDRTAFTLFDRDENEPWPFCQLSENHPEISDYEIFNHLPWHEAIVIDNDFISCFNSEREAKIWIRDNIPECVITGDLEWRPVFYIKHDKQWN